MINLLKEKENLWDYLSNQSKPIVIYGMGDGAIKIMNVCKDCHLVYSFNRVACSKHI